MSSSRQLLLSSALTTINQIGYEATTVAAICQLSGVSNGSFFHHFGSKEGLAGAIFLEALRAYHGELVAVFADRPSAEDGICRVITTHVRWVKTHRDQAQFMFAQTRPEWMRSIQEDQQAENGRFALAVEAWRRPLIENGVLDDSPALAFFSQVIGPAQLMCRGWLASPESMDLDPYLEFLSQCAIRALVIQPFANRKRKQA